MRRIRRIGAAGATLLAIGAMAALPVGAGNFAEVIMDEAASDPPVAGEGREIRFTLLQHGVTPVNDGEVTLTATLEGSAERVSVAATSVGNGAWVATITVPTAGEWELEVTHSVLATSPPTAWSVGAANSAGGSVGLTLGGLAAGSLLLLGTVALARRRRPVRRGAAVTRPA